MRVMCRVLAAAVLLTPAATRIHAEPPHTPPATLRVASVQMQVTPDLEANLGRILLGIEQASEANARMVCFPETALSGFSRETIETLDWGTVEEAMRTVAACARQHGCYVLYGTATSGEHPRPYNSAVLVDPAGNEVFRYHKSFPEPWFEPGERLALFEVDGVPATVIVCHDNRFPELVRLPVLAGARICFYISYEINGVADAWKKREGYRAQLIARAAENGVWVVQSNGVGPLDGAERISLGDSRIVDPAGVVVAQAPALQDHMLVHDLAPEAAGRGNALEGMQGKLLSDWWEMGVQQLEARLEAIDTVKRPAPRGRDRLRIAIMQAVPEKWNLDRNFEVFLDCLDQAHGADLLVTPECWLDGYAAPDESSTAERLRTVAQDPADSPYLRRVAEEAGKRGLWICFGFTSIIDGRIFNSAGLWNDRGALVGIYHKTHLQTHDLQYTPGDSLPVWPTPWGPVGIMICADRRWPETARTLRLQGARLILNPTYGMHHLDNEWWMRTRGYENQCYIAFAHPRVGFVVNPRGGLEAKMVDTPGVLLCDVDLKRASDDNHIADRRPEIYGPIAAE